MDPISKQHFNTLCLTVNDGRMQNMLQKKCKIYSRNNFGSERHGVGDDGGGGGGGI